MTISIARRLLPAACLLLGACHDDQSATSKQIVPFTSKPQVEIRSFAPGVKKDDAGKYFLGDDAKKVIDNFLAGLPGEPESEINKKKEKVANLCLQTPITAPKDPNDTKAHAEIAGTLAIVAATVVGQIIKDIIGWVDDKLQKDLATYTATYKGAVTYPAYLPQGAPHIGTTCLRIDAKDDKGKDTLLTAIIQLRIDREIGVYQMRPLLLGMFGKAVKKSEDNTHSISLAVKLEGMQSSAGAGPQTLFDDEIAGLDYIEGDKLPDGANKWEAAPIGAYVPQFGSDNTIDQDADAKALGVQSWDNAAVIALPGTLPLPGSAQLKSGNGVVRATVTVTEIGKPPEWKKFFGQLLHDNKDDVSKSLTDAVKKRNKGLFGSSS